MKKTATTMKTKKSGAKEGKEASPSQLIDARIRELGGAAKRSPESELSSSRQTPT